MNAQNRDRPINTEDNLVVARSGVRELEEGDSELQMFRYKMKHENKNCSIGSIINILVT